MIKNKYLTLKNKAFLVYKLIKKNQKQKYPTPFLNKLFVQLGDVYSDFSNRFLLSETGEDITHSDLCNMAKFIDATNNMVLTTLDNASNIKNPKAITIPIREMIERNGDSTVYIPELIWETNYYIGEISNVYNRFIQSIGIESLLDIKLYRFGIPHFYQDDVLMSGILGHELGHYFDLYGGLRVTEQLLTIFTNDKDFVNSLIPFVVSENGMILNEGTKIEVVKLFLTKSRLYMENWVKEFVADVLGIMLYGPSSFFSSERLIQSSHIYQEESEGFDRGVVSHPRSLLRYIIKKQTFEYLNYDNLPESFISEIEKSKAVWMSARVGYVTQIETIGSVKDTKVGFRANECALKLIEKYLIGKFHLIIEYCFKAIPDQLIYSPSVMDESLKQLCAKLGQMLPPNEVFYNKPSDNISIINAGWLAYFEPSNLLNTQYPSNDELLEAINSMLIRALEVSSIHRRWQNVHTE